MSKDFIERPRINEKDGAIQYVKQLLEQALEEHRTEDVNKLEELIRLLQTKKYGLVWEEHAEIVEEEMKTKIPVFVEDVEKKIAGDPDSHNYNFLLEGDNLHSLRLLEKTHAGKIDVIYIDPPYNTGNKDFIYNDKIIDKNDGYSHSKWLSFMSKRLEYARVLLNDSGLIYISIDNNEQSQLKLLCDSIFGETNFVANLIWSNREGGGSSDSKLFRLKHEYILVYSKNIDAVEIKGVPISNEDRYKLSDEYEVTRGKYYLQKLGMGSIQYSESLDYPIEAPDGSFIMPSDNNNGKKACWRWSRKKFEWGLKNGFVEIKQNVKDEWVVYTKQYLKADNDGNIILRSQRPMGVIDSFSSTQGAKQLKNIIPDAPFSYPKDTNLISWLLDRTDNKNSQVLDFFAGSGTTGHAVEQLNQEDGGNRRYILCTNNENNICEEVTYKRLTNIQKELPHNLKYFKTDFVVREEFPDVQLENELLNYITPLVELEFGIDISNPAVQIILTEEHLADLIKEGKLEKDSTLFIHSEVFLDSKEEAVLSKLNISRQVIPDYYFGKELWS
ncbi:MAG: site-specific DNA-methyltransferase [Carnobacterium sp.]|nr:site-specific DNA-methyltransferase [Carnobacterium sp.]